MKILKERMTKMTCTAGYTLWKDHLERLKIDSRRFVAWLLGVKIDFEINLFFCRTHQWVISAVSPHWLTRLSVQQIKVCQKIKA